MNIKDIIVRTVDQSAKSAEENAGYAGSMHDGGASTMRNRLEYWLDGIEFAQTGKSNKYGDIIRRYEVQQDPDWEEYNRLKEKFRDIKV